ncbi:MAG TPA: hypothetical protein DIW47_01360 [Bacteroidetes bacterium]|nr:hypothetical protein [Bacteroidota bacterium]
MKSLNKLFLLAIISFLSLQNSYAQLSFSHSFGASIYVSSLAAAPGLMYSPRLNFLELSDETSLSVGTHLGLGFSYNSQDGAGSFALDVPLVAEINFGHGALPDTESNFGGFLGLGYGISRIGSDATFGADYNEAAGPVFNGGIRTYIWDRPLGLRASYLINTKEGYANVFSLGLFYTLGEY